MKDLSAQHYVLCNLTAAEMNYVAKAIIDMVASHSRHKAMKG
jgi:hypothetical protein